MRCLRHIYAQLLCIQDRTVVEFNELDPADPLILLSNFGTDMPWIHYHFLGITSTRRSEQDGRSPYVGVSRTLIRSDQKRP